MCMYIYIYVCITIYIYMYVIYIYIYHNISSHLYTVFLSCLIFQDGQSMRMSDDGNIDLSQTWKTQSG